MTSISLLGIFYEDNASKQRWALKANDPKILNDIDAVFVTGEPDGGSQHPSGKRLLFAYLRVTPNHPWPAAHISMSIAELVCRTVLPRQFPMLSFLRLWCWPRNPGRDGTFPVEIRGQTGRFPKFVSI